MPRHPLDPLSLLLGLAFVGLGVAGLGTWIDIRHADSDWITPVTLVLLGLVVVASLLFAVGAPVRRGRPGTSTSDPGVGDASGSRDP